MGDILKGGAVARGSIHIIFWRRKNKYGLDILTNLKDPLKFLPYITWVLNMQCTCHETNTYALSF